METICPGVRPSMFLASVPTPSTFPVFLLNATIEGSSTTIPLPVAYTRVFAVPRSMARSEENMLRRDHALIVEKYTSCVQMAIFVVVNGRKLAKLIGRWFAPDSRREFTFTEPLSTDSSLGEGIAPQLRRQEYSDASHHNCSGADRRGRNSLADQHIYSNAKPDQNDSERGGRNRGSGLGPAGHGFMGNREQLQNLPVVTPLAAGRRPQSPAPRFPVRD